MAIFRGTGGAGDSTDDSIVSEVTEQAGIATTKAQEAATSATNASNSASSASSSETAASNSATAAAGSASTATTKATEAASHASDALASKNAAATSATAAADSATAANSANVQTVAGLSTEITNLNGIRTDITGVNAVRADVVTVSGISSDVTTVAADASDIGTVATNITNVNNVGDNISNVNAVHSNASNINTVAADGSDIGTVAGNISNVNTVAGISSDVTTVAGLESKMDAVIADASDIGAVAGNIGNVNTVAGDSSDINTVAGISADVTAVADNMTDVQNADTNAANAATSASNASDSASAASTSASNASSSASSASTSATNAGNSASASSNSATAASASKDAAASSASAASGSASAAASSASAASTSASNAATSETNSEGSENASALSATAAATSASNAATSESNAATSATNAAVSETNAAASETNAAASYDSFDDRYLGVKSSAPSTDNDGGALLTGALYFNSTNNTMNVFTGSAWAAVANNNIINPNVALTQDLATNGNDVKFGDNDKATFGASDDLQIYNNGSNSYISESHASGNLFIKGTHIYLQNSSGQDALNLINGDAYIKSGGQTKLATTATGIDVTGTGSFSSGVNINSYGVGLLIGGGTTGSTAIGVVKNSAGRMAVDTDGTRSLDLSTGGTKRLSANGLTGDISFYEDTGTTPKLTWDASAEMLTTSGLTVDAGTANTVATFSSTDIGAYLNIADQYQTGRLNATGAVFAIEADPSNLYASSKVRLSTDGVKRLDVDSNGDISFYEDTGTTPKFLWSASDEKLTIDGNGTTVTNLSTAISQAVLELNGNSQAGSDALYFGTKGGTGASYLQTSNGNGTAANYPLLLNPYGGNVGIGTSSPSEKLQVDGNIRLGPAHTTRIGTDGTNAYFENFANGAVIFRNNGYTERARIDSSGRVGIGTSSPYAPLTVRGTGDQIILDLNTSTNGAYSAISWNTSTSDLGGLYGAEIRGYRDAAGAYGSLAFHTRPNGEALRIDQTGRVGIGTSSPSSYDGNADNLVIGGDSAVGLTLASSATNGRGSIYFADGTSGDQKYRGTVNYFHDSDALTITTAAAERMRIDSSGNVGIGTSSLTSSAGYETLSINGTTGGQIAFQTGGSAKQFIYSTSTDLSIYNQEEGNIRLVTNNTEAMRIGSTGLVGIGKTPSYFRLDVQASATGGNVLRGMHGTAEFQLYQANNSHTFLGTANSADLVFNTATAERMRIDSSGNLLVGQSSTTVPGTGNTTAGISLRGGVGAIHASRDGNRALYVNRNTTDGPVISVEKAGVEVGSIGTFTGYTTVGGNTNGGLIFRNGEILPWNNATGAYSNGGIDLGDGNAKFKDLHLSGTAYAGVLNLKDSNTNGQINCLTPTGGKLYTNTYAEQISQIQGSEKMRLDSSGNLLVGKTAANLTTTGVEIDPNGILLVTKNAGTVAYFNRLTNDGTIADFRKDGSPVGNIGTFGGYQYIIGGNAGGTHAGLRFINNASIRPCGSTGNDLNATLDLGTSAARFKNLYLSGSVYAGNSTNTAGNLFLHIDGDADGVSTGYKIRSGVAVSTGSSHIAFVNPNGIVGQIRTDGSATSYNTSSDERLKQNIQDADDAGRKVDAIQVRKYDWKVDGSHQDYGMIAQELQAVAPEAVSGDADSEEMMGVDYSKLVPMLIKEIQSLRNRVAQLEE